MGLLNVVGDQSPFMALRVRHHVPVKPRVGFMLSTQTIGELKTIVLEEYGRDLSLEETTDLAKGLVSYFDLLAEVHHRSAHTISGQEVISKSSKIKLAEHISRG